MANIKLVIKIDEDVYTRLFDNGIQDNAIAVDDVCEMARVLRFGIPLPKGYGRLVDADELLKQSYRIDDSATLSTRDVVNAEEIDNAPTIIEPYKEESEEDDGKNNI